MTTPTDPNLDTDIQGLLDIVFSAAIVRADFDEVQMRQTVAEALLAAGWTPPSQALTPAAAQ